MPRAAKVVLALVGVVALGIVGLGAFVWVTFSGGLDDALPRRRPTERSTEVVKARAEAAETTRAAVTAIVEGPVREALGAALRQPATLGPPTTKDECTEGQHNYQVDDPYDLRCTMQATVVAVAARDGFRDHMLRLHDRLGAAGWQPSPSQDGIPEAILEYWDAHNGSFPGSPSQDDMYTPVDLPMEQYRREDDGSVRLEVKWTDRSDRIRPESTAIAERDYGVVLTYERVYFER
jgi:hypothetical protein